MSLPNPSDRTGLLKTLLPILFLPTIIHAQSGATGSASALLSMEETAGSRPPLATADCGIDSMQNDETDVTIESDEEEIRVETSTLSFAIRKMGYVTGIKGGSFVDRKTGARDLGFGLDIVDWIMEPGSDEAYRDRLDPELVYKFGNSYHGNIPKRSIEGPQICTQAKQLDPKVTNHGPFVSATMQFQYKTCAPGKKAGSVWKQTLVFPKGERFFFSMDEVTVVNDGTATFLRLDMPGHIKHNKGDTFSEVYLSYHGDQDKPKPISSSEFLVDFPPDARFRYVRGTEIPKRMIRAYRIRNKDGTDGPWLAGMTLDASLVSEAWCHQRGYVCLIEEFGGKPIKAGETFRAAFLVGYFDSIEEMHSTYDLYRGISHVTVEKEDYFLLDSKGNSLPLP